MKYFAILLATAASTPAIAQDTRSAQSGDIIVTATGQSAAISTTKSATPIIESPQSISIISKEELNLRPSPNITDALAYTAGVVAAPGGMDSRVDNISLRGRLHGQQ